MTFDKRADLYQEAGASKLVKAYEQTRKGVETSAAKVEEFPQTPFSENNARNLEAQASALAVIGKELRAWHEFLYKDKP